MGLHGNTGTGASACLCRTGLAPSEDTGGRVRTCRKLVALLGMVGLLAAATAVATMDSGGVTVEVDGVTYTYAFNRGSPARGLRAASQRPGTPVQ